MAKMIIKKTYKLEDLDCANCAAKMEERIKKIDGVVSANVSFIMQKLTIEAEESELDKIVKEAAKICKKVEPDCRIIL
jgi:copper chaperone CopZ